MSYGLVMTHFICTFSNVFWVSSKNFEFNFRNIAIFCFTFIAFIICSTLIVFLAVKLLQLHQYIYSQISDQKVRGYRELSSCLILLMLNYPLAKLIPNFHFFAYCIASSLIYYSQTKKLIRAASWMVAALIFSQIHIVLLALSTSFFFEIKTVIFN